MLQIRRGTFETNSSSSHSFTIGVNETPEYMFPVGVTMHGVVCVTGGDFGWGYEELTDSIDKLNYVVQSLIRLDVVYKNDPVYDQMVDRADTLVTNEGVVITGYTDCRDGDTLDTLLNMITEYSGVKIELDLVDIYSGSIDHQSYGLLNELNVQQLFDLVVRPDSRIIIDNDNH